MWGRMVSCAPMVNRCRRAQPGCVAEVFLPVYGDGPSPLFSVSPRLRGEYAGSCLVLASPLRYFAKLTRNPVDSNTSFLSRPGNGSLTNRSLNVRCHPSHFLIAVTPVISKFMRYCPVSLRFGYMRNDCVTLVAPEAFQSRSSPKFTSAEPRFRVVKLSCS